MKGKELFDLVEGYGARYPRIQDILDIFEKAERYLVELDQSERLGTLARTSNTNEGRYELPADCSA